MTFGNRGLISLTIVEQAWQPLYMHWSRRDEAVFVRIRELETTYALQLRIGLNRRRKTIPSTIVKQLTTLFRKLIEECFDINVQNVIGKHHKLLFFANF